MAGAYPNQGRSGRAAMKLTAETAMATCAQYFAR